jgi:beta-xylosidase
MFMAMVSSSAPGEIAKMRLPRALALLPWAVGLAAADNFTNPFIYADYPDNDVSVGPDGAYYFSASNFHYSPGAPILRSEDLINWEPVGHSLPRLNFGDGYDLKNGERQYRGGTWASTLRYRKSNGLWYWIGCTNFWITHFFTAPSVEGPWEEKSNLPGQCWYDMGLMVDDDDTMYTVWGNPNVSISQLDADGLKPIRTEVAFRASDLNHTSIEGNRLYKINGLYYVLNDQPETATTYIWKSESPWGPWDHKELVRGVKGPIEGGNSPHQGSLIETPDGDWYFMSFTWAYPAGRMPVLAPLTWGDDGFPILVKGENGGWGAEYPLPLPEVETPPLTDTYEFEGPDLPPAFEWNHNPDDAAYSVDNGLTLSTSSVTDDIFQARNTLTHRLIGEFPAATVEIDFENAAAGDRFGFAAFRDKTSYIGVHVSDDGSEYTITALHDAVIGEWDGQPVKDGDVVATFKLPADADKKIWFRIELDARPNGTRESKYFYSLDGDDFTQLGDSYELYNGWAFFIAYRFGIFNFATTELGGSIKVNSLTVGNVLRCPSSR